MCVCNKIDAHISMGKKNRKIPVGSTFIEIYEKKKPKKKPCRC